MLHEVEDAIAAIRDRKSPPFISLSSRVGVRLLKALDSVFSLIQAHSGGGSDAGEGGAYIAFRVAQNQKRDPDHPNVERFRPDGTAKDLSIEHHEWFSSQAHHSLLHETRCNAKK
jgi:hypothetical protein